MFYFITIYFIIFTLITWRNLPTAMAIVIALLPTYLIRFHIWVFPSTLLEGMVLIVIAVWFVQFGFKKVYKRYKHEIIYKPFPFQAQIILIMITATISILIAPNIWKALGLWRAYFLEPILFFLIFIQVVKTRKNLQKILYALGISALGISLFAIYQKITGNFIPVAMWQPEETRRVTSFYTSPNAVGLYLGPIVMIYLGWLFDSKKILSTFWKILILISSLLAIIFTVSEGTWAGLIVALIFFIVMFFQKNIQGIKKSTLIIIFILLIAIGSALFYQPVIKNKVDQIISTPSAQNRITLWQGALNFLTQNPKNFLFGSGIYGFNEIQEKFRDPLKLEPLIYPHNIFLNFWMEIGLVGMITFVWLIISFLKKIYNTNTQIYINKMLNIGLVSAIITIIIHGLIDVPYFKNDLAMLFWIILGISITLNYYETKESIEK